MAATFVATLLGVGLAQSWADWSREQDDRRAYTTLLAVMHTDCERSLKRNMELRDKLLFADIERAPFLHIGALQNALLFRHMKDDELLVDLMGAMTSAAAAEAAYAEIRTGLPPPGAESRVPCGITDAKPEDWQSCIREQRQATEQHLKGALRAYLDAQGRVCRLLASAVSR